MELSRSCEATSRSATRHFPKTLWNQKIHYRAHKSLPLVPVLSQMNTFTSYFSKIHLDIVSHLRLHFLVTLPPKLYIHSSSPPPPICATCPSSLIFIDFIIRIIHFEEHKLCSSSLSILLILKFSFKCFPHHLLLSYYTYRHCLFIEALFTSTLTSSDHQISMSRLTCSHFQVLCIKRISCFVRSCAIVCIVIC
jgi:hypothetical protein